MHGLTQPYRPIEYFFRPLSDRFEAASAQSEGPHPPCIAEVLKLKNCLSAIKKGALGAPHMTGGQGLFRLNTCCLDNLAPFLGFICLELGKLSRRSSPFACS